MAETITMPKFYSNREVAEILGIQPATVRQIKSRRSQELEDLWRNDNDDGETIWTEEGLNKIAEFCQTDEAKNFRAGALARRTQEAIAVDRAEISYQDDIEKVSTRTGHEVHSYEVQNPTSEGGRYDALPTRIGSAIGETLINNGAIAEVDKAVVNRLLRELSIGDIDIEALLSN